MSRNFYALFSLTKRGIKLFLKDRAGVFFSLLAPLIVLLLYVLFLADVQLQSLRSYLMDLPVSDELAGAFVDGWMLAGAVSVACITVPFSAQSIMIKDKETGSLADMLVSPVSRRIIQLSYLTAVFVVSSCICLVVLAVAFVYLAITGWYLSAADAFALAGLLIFSVLSASVLSNIICSFISTQGAHGAFTGILSAAIGFLVGAYMPLSMFPTGVQYGVLILPGTYSAGAFRNLFMRGALNEISALSMPAGEGLAEGFSLTLDFFGSPIGLSWQLWLFAATTLVVAAAAFAVRLMLKKKTYDFASVGKKKKN